MFRAFTTAAVALARGAEKIILTAEPEEALALRAAGVGELCLGEVGGIRPPGFDFGNSPFELSQADVAGKTLIQSTRAGTVGVCAVPQPPRALRRGVRHRGCDRAGDPARDAAAGHAGCHGRPDDATQRRG